jgi:threonine/homoserine/homoserine lactone efflux protein
MEFFIASLIVVLLPGTGVIYTLAIGLGRGFKASVAAAFGCTFGILPAAVASIVGLAAIFHTSAFAFHIVKYVGVAYLLYMAWKILRDDGTLEVEEDQKSISMFRTGFNGTLLNVFNPKLSLFFLAFLPQFVDATDPSATLTMVMLAGFFMLLTFIVFVGYGGCAALARDYVISRPTIMKWLKRSFATAFGYLSFKLALAER